MLFHRKIIYIMGIVLLFIMGCQSQGIVEDTDKDIKIVNMNKPLEQLVNDYYSLEMSESWDLTYEYRTPLFKQSISKEDYIATFKEENKGWKLTSFKIISLNVNNDVANIDIEFIEQPKNQDLVYKTIEPTKWKKINNRWFIVRPGNRGHLSLNSEMIVE